MHQLLNEINRFDHHLDQPDDMMPMHNGTAPIMDTSFTSSGATTMMRSPADTLQRRSRRRSGSRLSDIFRELLMPWKHGDRQSKSSTLVRLARRDSQYDDEGLLCAHRSSSLLACFCFDSMSWNRVGVSRSSIHFARLLDLLLLDNRSSPDVHVSFCL
jgi:hypothetical protein